MLERVWGCRLATYRSYGACWSGFGAVGWQPTGLMGHVGASLGMSFGNLQVLLWCVLELLWGCMLAIYRSHGEGGIVCWQTTGLIEGFGCSTSAACTKTFPIETAIGN